MPWVGFELTIPAFERTKTVHALDRAATVIGGRDINISKILGQRIWKRSSLRKRTQYSGNTALFICPTEKAPLSLSLSLWLFSTLLDFSYFFSFLIYTQAVGLLGRGISQSQGHSLHTEQRKHVINAHKHPCLEGIRTHDPSVRAGKGGSCLRSHGHCDRLKGDNVCTVNRQETKVSKDERKTRTTSIKGNRDSSADWQTRHASFGVMYRRIKCRYYFVSNEKMAWLNIISDVWEGKTSIREWETHTKL
jgi:hypothetical protein